MNSSFSFDERVAASAVLNMNNPSASLSVDMSSTKRGAEGDDAAGVNRPDKLARTDNMMEGVSTIPAPKPKKQGPSVEHAEKQPYPFFTYKDFSQEPDEDPLTPLTPPGRVPTFVAKMHAILSRDDYKDVIDWMPHGRAWRILKPREFEIKVIPKFFEHAKFSSFVRQANGWGFRRITQGRDRNAYYHPQFLRGLPHLCKNMKRPGVNEKKASDPNEEPDLYEISRLHPVPERTDDDSILLHCTVQNGPRARMPIYCGAFTSNTASASTSNNVAHVTPAMEKPATTTGTPHDQMALNIFTQSLAKTESQVRGQDAMSISPPPATKPVVFNVQPQQYQGKKQPAQQSTQRLLNAQGANGSNGGSQNLAALAAANQMAMNFPMMPNMSGNSAAMSQFAAGFAAATAFSQQHFSNMFQQMAQQHQQNTSGNNNC